MAIALASSRTAQSSKAEKWNARKWFEPEFDSRQQMFPGLPAPGNDLVEHFGMVVGGGWFEHVIDTKGRIEQLIERLKITGPRQARFS